MRVRAKIAMEKPDIIGIIEKEGIDLRQRGRHFWGLCPIHTERTPSFCVDQEKQRFKCFGCGAGGDVIDFVMKYKRLPFRDSLKYLGVSGDSREIKSDPLELKKRKLVKKFNRWIQLYRRAICELLRLANKVGLKVTNLEDLEISGIDEMYRQRDIYEYHLLILNGDDDKAKFLLYKEVACENN